jgi:VWFA-related protein
LLCLAFHLLAQQPTIRTSVPLVVLPATVTDRSGHFLTDLSASDFVVLDDGKPATIHLDDVDLQTSPVALVMAIQTSDISSSALAKIRKTGAMISQAVAGANAEMAVVTFSDHVTVAQDFTSDGDAVAEVFQNLKPVDTTEGRMIDAVQQSVAMLAARPGPRRAAIVVISESKDRGSEGKLSDLVRAIQRTRITVYTLTYSAYLTPFTTRPADYSPPSITASANARNQVSFGPMITELARLAKKNTVQALARATGGQQLKFETKSKLENDLIRLGSDIHSRYVISFTPGDTSEPKFHRLEVRIKNRPNLIVHTRPGYWSGLVDHQP